MGIKRDRKLSLFYYLFFKAKNEVLNSLFDNYRNLMLLISDGKQLYSMNERQIDC